MAVMGSVDMIDKLASTTVPVTSGGKVKLHYSCVMCDVCMMMVVEVIRRL